MLKVKVIIDIFRIFYFEVTKINLVYRDHHEIGIKNRSI
jgi:hypothetical protein